MHDAREAYLRAVRPVLPRLIDAVGGTPAGAALPAASPDDAASHPARSAAALALALFVELDPTSPVAGLAGECIRAGLIRWQMSLDSTGAPSSRRLRREPGACARALADTADLLLETARHQGPGLIDDLHRCAGWLAGPLAAAASRSTALTADAQAAVAHALINVAALARDAAALENGRGRLGRWLASQDEEGWFPDACGRLTFARQFAVLDTLARVHARTGWAEVDRAAQRLIRFLTPLMAPPTTAAGVDGGFDVSMLAAFAFEWAAPRHAEAVRPAMAARRRCASPQPWSRTAATGPAAARLCAALMRAADGAADLDASDLAPDDAPAFRHFRRAAVSVFNGRAYRAVVDFNRGGRVRIWWRNSAAPVDDPPPLAVHATGLAQVRQRPARRRVWPNGASCAARPTRVADTQSRFAFGKVLGWQRGRAAARAVLQACAALFAWTGRPRTARRRCGNRHVRCVVFSDRTITILDRIRGLTPCLSVWCGDASAGAAPDEPSGLASAAPLCVPGGRDVRIRRVYRDGQPVEVEAHSAPRRRRRRRPPLASPRLRPHDIT